MHEGDQSAVSVGFITIESCEGLAYVTLSHPGRLNAITVAMWHELRRVFEALSADDTLRCVVIRGADGNFAAGADIREFPDVRGDITQVRHYHQHVLAPALKAIANCPHPVIAQIEGVCVGGGLEVACQADIRIASESARFGVPINKLGFSMAPDEMQGLLDVIGRSATVALLLEGRVFEANEALAIGLLHRIVPSNELVTHVQASAERIMRGAPLAARINKRQSRRLQEPKPLTESDYRDFFSYAESRDHQEGVSAFLAGRAPQFTGD